MAITLQTQPPVVALSGNSIWFGLKTNNHLETTGSSIQAEITFGSIGLVNDRFTLSWGNESQQFICQEQPDESGNQIPTTPVNLNDWVRAVGQALSLNYFVDRDFIVSSNTSVLTLIAREKGSGFSISLEKTWTGAAPFITQSGGVDIVPRIFFKIGMQLLIKSGDVYSKISEDTLPVNEDGECLFDLQALFSDQLSSEFSYPESSYNLLISRPSHSRAYKVRYYEQFGSNLVPQKLYETDLFYILKGGVSHLQQAIYHSQGSSFWDKLNYNQFFLTWQPQVKLIDPEQTEKLYFFVRNIVLMASLKVRATVYYLDGTSQTVLVDIVNNPEDKTVYEIICTLNTLQFDGFDQGLIEKYDIWVDNHADERISEVRTFILDYGPYEYKRYLFFENSLGGWDTVRATGIQEDGIELSRTEVSRVLGSQFTPAQHHQVTAQVLETKTYKLNSGWKTKEEISWLRDLLLSKKVYQIVGGLLVPIVLTTTKVLQRVDQQDLYSLSIEFSRAYRNAFYTKQYPGSVFSDDFNDDFAYE